MSNATVGLDPATAELLEKAFTKLGITAEYGITELGRYYQGSAIGGMVSMLILSTVLMFVGARIMKNAANKDAANNKWRADGCRGDRGEYPEPASEHEWGISIGLFVVGVAASIGVLCLIPDTIGVIVSPIGYTINEIIQAVE